LGITPKDGIALLIVEVWKSLVTCNRLIGKDANDYPAKLLGFAYDIEMTGVYDVGAHANVNCFHLRRYLPFIIFHFVQRYIIFPNAQAFLGIFFVLATRKSFLFCQNML
jgi:hypothetical protein